MTAMINASISVRDWQAGTDELLTGQLTGHQLIDLEKLEVGGLLGGRRLAQHIMLAADETGEDAAVPVTMEQWSALVDGTGYTLTATVVLPVRRAGGRSRRDRRNPVLHAGRCRVSVRVRDGVVRLTPEDWYDAVADRGTPSSMADVPDIDLASPCSPRASQQ